MNDWRALRPVMPILVGASIMLTLSMGIRQTFGLFLQPVTRDLALSVSDFTLALSIQNLTWGLLQPIAGALVVRLGFRPILVAGAVLYLAGLLTLAAAHDLLGVLAGGGLLIGVSLACTASAMAQAAASRVVPARNPQSGARDHHRRRHPGRAGGRAARAGGDGRSWLAVGHAGAVRLCRCCCCRRPGSRAASIASRCRRRLADRSPTRRSPPRSARRLPGRRSW